MPGSRANTFLMVCEKRGPRNVLRTVTAHFDERLELYDGLPGGHFIPAPVQTVWWRLCRQRLTR